MRGKCLIICLAFFVSNAAFLQDAFAGGSITPLDKAPWKQHPDSKAVVRFLATPKLNSTKSAFVSHLTMQPGSSVPEHRDFTEEYIFMLEGSGTIWMDDVKHEVKKGDLIYMPANAKVRFQASKSEKVKVLQIFAPPGPEKKYDTWIELKK